MAPGNIALAVSPAAFLLLPIRVLLCTTYPGSNCLSALSGRDYGLAEHGEDTATNCHCHRSTVLPGNVLSTLAVPRGIRRTAGRSSGQRRYVGARLASGVANREHHPPTFVTFDAACRPFVGEALFFFFFPFCHCQELAQRCPKFPPVISR